MTYPCIVYNKTDKSREYGNNVIYLSTQGYQITVIEQQKGTDVADNIESHFQHCVIDQYYTISNLNHTKLNLYY